MDYTPEALKKILGKHAAWLVDSKKGGRAYLGGAYLGGANLDGANLDGANLGRAYLGGAYLGRAYLGGANLDGANLGRAYLGGANLGRAYLGGAYLGGAYLGGADLDGADLGGANLDGANLDGANLGRAKGLIDLGQTSRGFRMVAVQFDDAPTIGCGCRWFTLPEAREYWSPKTYTNATAPYADEMQARLDAAEAIARLKGWDVPGQGS